MVDVSFTRVMAGQYKAITSDGREYFISRDSIRGKPNGWKYEAGIGSWDQGYSYGISTLDSAKELLIEHVKRTAKNAPPPKPVVTPEELRTIKEDYRGYRLYVWNVSDNQWCADIVQPIEGTSERKLIHTLYKPTSDESLKAAKLWVNDALMPSAEDRIAAARSVLELWTAWRTRYHSESETVSMYLFGQFMIDIDSAISGTRPLQQCQAKLKAYLNIIADSTNEVQP